MSRIQLIILGLYAVFYVCYGSRNIYESYEAEFEEKVIEVGNNDLVSSKCMRCICMVESKCQEIGCRMDVGSLSCGPFQIKQPYWEDCGSPGGDYERCAKDYVCSYKCVEAYMARYIGPSRCPKNCESYARIHNGGPNGCNSATTFGYWKKMTQQGCTPNS